MEYNLRQYHISDLEKITTLLDGAFAMRAINKEKVVQWKYFDAFHKEKTITYVAENQSGQIVSQYTNAPIVIWKSGKVYKSMMCLDMATDTQHRGKKLISRLSTLVYEKVCQQGYDFSFGISNQQGVEIDRKATNYGYKVIGQFHTYFSSFSICKNNKFHIKPCKQLDGNYSETKSNYFAVYKTHQYMLWRYIAKPESSYELFKIVTGNDTFMGYVVSTKSKGVLQIIDILMVNGYVLSEEVFIAFRNYASSLGCIGIKISLICDHKIHSQLQRAGYRRLGFLQKAKYYLTVKKHNLHLSKDIFSKEAWLLFSGAIL